MWAECPIARCSVGFRHRFRRAPRSCKSRHVHDNSRCPISLRLAFDLLTIGAEIRRRGEQEIEQRYEEGDPTDGKQQTPPRSDQADRHAEARRPRRAAPARKDYVPPKSTAYTVKDGDSWESVAQMHGLSARTLIAHNFKRRI